MKQDSNVVLFAMPNCQNLGNEISDIVKIPLSPISRTVYADGEAMLVSEACVRGKDTYVVASTHMPVNQNLMELLLFVDSLKRASAKTINVVLSYYGYARQDRKSSGRQPISAKLVAGLLEKAGVQKIIAVDLHNPAIQGFFDIPVDDLRGAYTLAKRIRESKDRFTVVSPDHGGTIRARKLAELIANTVKIAIIDKRRTGANQAEAMGLIGDVKGQNVVIIDDIIDTGGTIIKAVNTLKENGAKKVIVAATHGLFTKGFEMFEENPNIEKVIITDSIDHSDMINRFTKLDVVSLGFFLGNVILASIEGRSISSLYEEFESEIKC
ncbi:ribose-phosphate pyrophosphokinase [Mycoplasmopsis opalescens]|uniref:ribose-phosphate pyrophosphokinase n=1 Tax=Mycoplasmopsis opalescens TaxID=114886 RepID=UPI0004A719D6|nr:ribose-phosphate pyrophosphokinase [Mycoplasmopsis opalescens]